MDLKEVINNAVQAKRAESLKKSPQLTLGELILKLEPLEHNKTVRFDFEYAYPESIGSWRGSYDELSLRFVFEGEAPTVASLLEKLNSAVGATYQGYKGGEFSMSKHTPVWVANYGNSGNTAVIGVLDNGYSIIIETKYCEF